MKYILSFIGVAVICCAIFLCGGNTDANEEYIRIHIVANSNSTQDQNIKYVVKDAIVNFLIPYLAEAESKEMAGEIVEQNLTKIAEVVSSALKAEGADYGANVYLTKEEIPTRSYETLVLEEGVYDCLKVELGDGEGDNWWCVVFPAVCFLDTKNSSNYEYISKIWDIISSVI